MSESAYPLSWPVGWKRTPAGSRKRANFATARNSAYGEGRRPLRELTVADGVDRVLDEFKRFGIPDYNVIISSNVTLTSMGRARSGQGEPDDPGAAVYWRDGEQRRVMAIDRYTRVADNLAAIAATLEAMRAIERHGGAIILDRAFTGFTALPAPGQTSARGWREILGLADAGTPTLGALDAAYRTARKIAHPDHGGNAEEFHAVQVAYEQAMQELRA